MDYNNLFSVLNSHSMTDWSSLLEKQLKDYFEKLNHGDYPKWQTAIDTLPNITPSITNFNSDAIVVGCEHDCTDIEKELMQQQLKVLMPWRKGPFNLFGNFIDTEWQSNMKWNRLKTQIKPLNDKLVLDIGCGNGYYGWRMLGEGARHVVGLDPTLLFLMQFAAVKKYLPSAKIDILPFAIQALADTALCFDTVFSMGVIYHRRDPMEHLTQLMHCLKPGGELVLEGLVLEGNTRDVLIPDGRYAKMNNVWAIPSTTLLAQWVEDAGFKHVRVVDVSRTRPDEQRRTEWMRFESLSDFLDKNDTNKTIEAYPAPTRAILLAEK